MTNNNEIIRNGLWGNNVALVQLLGLCPLLAVTSTVINGVGLGIATLITLVLSNTIVSLIRGFVRKEVRLPVFVLIIASVVTIIELGMKALFYDLYLVLGIFIPLIVTNCAIIGRAEGFASRNPVGPAALDGLMMGMGFLGVLALLGGLREIVGFGTLFANAHLMFGAAAKSLTIHLNQDYPGFLLAVLPPGAFFGLALLIGAKNWLDLRPQEKTETAEPLAEGA
ncbi:MAG: electron transport complex subunit E [Gammaproteobacteria bacterium]|nr:electron transport complex subunit E [Gammaproteobacteria bacterium]MDH3534989.1 electron transport complex subunit E [Gammaproteobacteria bacterium]